MTHEMHDMNAAGMMPQTFRRDRLTWLLYLLLAFYGYSLNLPGPITPFLRRELGLSYTVSSLHFSAFADAVDIQAAFAVVALLLAGDLLIIQLARRSSARG